MITDDPALEGAFKTPGLRGVADRAPHMNAGQFATLEQVVRHYVAAPRAAVGAAQPSIAPSRVSACNEAMRPRIAG